MLYSPERQQKPQAAPGLDQLRLQGPEADARQAAAAEPATLRGGYEGEGAATATLIGGGAGEIEK